MPSTAKVNINNKIKIMNCNEIDKILSGLKVNSLGVIRGKSKVTDKIHQAHLKEIDSKLMDVRVFVAKIKLGHISSEAQKQIDDFVYNMQIQ